MNKQIVVGEITLNVQQVYPYVYSGGRGKEVLRLSILREEHTSAEIEAALYPLTSDIVYQEDGKEVNIYRDYTADYTCSFENGVYQVELTRLDALSRKVAELEEQLVALQKIQNAIES